MTNLVTAPAPTRVPVGVLLDFAAAVLFAHGFPAARATTAAEALCHGDITGSPEHGLATLTRVHLPLLRSGALDPAAEPTIVADRGASVLLDGGTAPGLWLASTAVDLACHRAATHGVGLASVRGGLAYGRPARPALLAARRGMVGVVTLAGGITAVAVPGGGRPAMLLDATTPVARLVAALVPGTGEESCTALVIAPGTLRGTATVDRDAATLLSTVGAYPGCRAAARSTDADSCGVPLSHDLVDDLVRLARELGLRVPSAC